VTDESLSRRGFFHGISLVGVAALGVPSLTTATELRELGSKPATDIQPIEAITMNENNRVADEINKEKIRRALLSGPAAIAGEATVAELGHGGALTVLRKGTITGCVCPAMKTSSDRRTCALIPWGCNGCWM
jgi:hypothetical protein